MKIPEAVLTAINGALACKSKVLTAIDGRCGAGKTTLAAALATHYGCPVIHMDDFFLQPKQRTPERYKEPGGNVDYERVEEEILKPVLSGADFVYQRFDCRTMSMQEGQKRSWKRLRSQTKRQT